MEEILLPNICQFAVWLRIRIETLLQAKVSNLLFGGIFDKIVWVANGYFSDSWAEGTLGPLALGEVSFPCLVFRKDG